MKKKLVSILAGVIAFSSIAFADHYAGAIHSFDGDHIVFQDKAHKDPLRYRLTDKTVFHDQHGKVIQRSIIKPGWHSEVTYSKHAEHGQHADKIVVTVPSSH
jgi:hypothetical protein